jgi:hypothetical protein
MIKKFFVLFIVLIFFFVPAVTYADEKIQAIHGPDGEILIDLWKKRTTEEYITIIKALGTVKMPPLPERLREKEEEISCISDKTAEKLVKRIDKEVINMENLKKWVPKIFKTYVWRRSHFFAKEIRHEVTQKNGGRFKTQEELFKAMFPTFKTFRSRMQARIRAYMKIYMRAKIMPMNQKIIMPVASKETSKKLTAYFKRLRKELKSSLTDEEQSAIRDYARAKNRSKIRGRVQKIMEKRMKEIMPQHGHKLVRVYAYRWQSGEGLKSWIGQNWKGYQSIYKQKE